MRVLVVEDDFVQGYALMELLEAAGHTPVGPALDGTAAAYFAAKDRPDFALVDLTLQHGDKGHEVARELRARFGVSALFMTGQGDTARAHRDDALGCVHKPFTSDCILRSVEVAAHIIGGTQPRDVPEGLELYD